MLVDPLTQLNKGASILYEMTGSGTATAFTLSSWRPMTIEEFKAEIVPTLQPSQTEGKFHYYSIRDLSNGRYLTVYPDGVIEYNVEEVRDASVDAVIQELQAGDEENPVETIINSSLPVYGYKDGVNWSLSVKIPETRFLFRNRNLFPDPTNYPHVYMPPVIFKVIGRGGSLSNRYVWILEQDSIAANNIKKAMMPLPNVWSDGKICVGRTAALNENQGNPSKMQLLMQAWDLFINSDWNFDLLNIDSFPSNLLTVFDKYKDPESYIAKKASSPNTNNPIKHLLMLLEILKEPGRWEELKWRTI